VTEIVIGAGAAYGGPVKWRTPITLLVLLLILLGSAYYGWQSVTAPAASDASTATTKPPVPCTKQVHVRKSRRVQAKHIVVNVYNAGVISGLAGSTSSKLASKGFRPGEVADAPAGIQATNVTVLSNTVHAPEVRLVAKQFVGRVAIRHGDLAPGVDVVVGNAFKAVDPHAKTVLVVRKKVHSCVRGSS
jgi:LytR cell envelope-related transcriptional attenuator